jgi:hypothetical protein
MRVPLASGITTDETGEFRTSYPLNLEIVPTNNKIAEAQFRGTSGAIPFGTGPGVDRGGIVWNEIHYRIMGTKLVSVAIDGTVAVLGDVGGSGPVSLDFGFDRLAIRSGTKLYYYSPTLGLIPVTDTDLGPVLDMLWIDGYFMTTDGTSIVVTELNDPTQVKPLKYGSAEEDPDMVTGLIKLRDEAYVMGLYTIQVFTNVGGNGFPFQTQKGATIPVGCVGANAKCLFADTFAFVGSTRNEAIGVYLAGSGTAARISTRLVDDELAKVADPSQIVVENRMSRGERRLLVHLPDKTLVFLANATRTLEQPIWYIAQSGLGDPYRLRNAVSAYGKTIVGDTQSAALGELSDTIFAQFGDAVEWQFDAGPLYNDGKGAIVTAAELIGLPGRSPASVEGTMFLSITRDGETWSAERVLPMGTRGQRYRRMQWRPRILLRTWLGFRFRGYSTAMPAFAALEISAEPLSA